MGGTPLEGEIDAWALCQPVRSSAELHGKHESLQSFEEQINATTGNLVGVHHFVFKPGDHRFFGAILHAHL